MTYQSRRAGPLAAAGRVVGYQAVIALFMAGACWYGAQHESPILGYIAALAIGASAASGAYTAWLRGLQSVTVFVSGWLLWDTMDGDPILGWLSWLGEHWMNVLAAAFIAAAVRVLVEHAKDGGSAA